MWTPLRTVSPMYTKTLQYTHTSTHIHALIRYICPMEEYSHTPSRPFLNHKAEMGYWQGNEMVMRAGALCDHLLTEGQKYREYFRQGSNSYTACETPVLSKNLKCRNVCCFFQLPIVWRKLALLLGWLKARVCVVFSGRKAGRTLESVGIKYYCKIQAIKAHTLASSIQRVQDLLSQMGFSDFIMTYVYLCFGLIKLGFRSWCAKLMVNSDGEHLQPLF